MGIYQYPRDYTRHKTKTYSYKKTGNIQLSPHFKLKEFQSKDGDDTIVVCPDLINAGLEKLFVWLPNVKSITVVSGYRSIQHSLAVGGKGAKDNHHMCIAADIKVKKTDNTYYKPSEIACALQDNGWTCGIGLMKTSIHIDTGSKYWFDETKNNREVADWHKYTGITHNYKIKTNTPKPTQNAPSNPVPAVKHRGTAYVLTTDKLNVRTRANKNSLKVGQYHRGETFYVVKWQGSWCQLESGNWMCARMYCRKK